MSETEKKGNGDNSALIESREGFEHKKFTTIIISPHCDDEVIGCYKILKESSSVIIIYMGTNTGQRREEATKLRQFFNVPAAYFSNDIPPMFIDPSNKYYFPDPIYETHPEHRKVGAYGEELARKKFDVIFYSTNMNAPYIHNVTNPDEKEKALNEIYTSQKKLWEYEHKYYLFEGYCKWIF